MNCERCHKKTATWIMSIFNTQHLCFLCKEKERNHPKYKEAKEAESEAVRKGKHNFPGIGLPLDLMGRT
jgi:hypothetical protein